MRASYPTLYEAHVAAGAKPVPCIDCGDGGRLTVHPLRLCRLHFIHRYGLDASSKTGPRYMSDLPTWDSERPRHGFRPWKTKLPLHPEDVRALHDLASRLAELTEEDADVVV